MNAIRTILKVLCLSLVAAGTVTAAPPAARAGVAVALPVASAATVLEGKININTATVDQLDMLPGIGPKTAERIVAYRKRHPFKKTLHLLRVKGIGRKKYERIKAFLAVDGETTLRPAGGQVRVSDPAH